MKKVLIVSYYFPPYTGIEGHRAFSWYTHFKNTGLYPIVITRLWKEGEQNSWKDYQSDCGDTIAIENTNNGEVHRLPYRAYNLFTRLSKIPLLGGIYYWLQKTFGNIHLETNAYDSFYQYSHQLCAKEKPDFIIVSSPPLNIIKIASKLYDEFKIPYAVDFRDSYNNRLLNPSFKPRLSMRVEDIIFKYYIKKWLKNVSFITGVSLPVNKMIKNIIDKPMFVVTNGYEAEIFHSINFTPDNIFRITIMGNIYPSQEIEFMIIGFNLFLSNKNSDNILIQFIGLGKYSIVGKNVLSQIDNKFLYVTERLPRAKALPYFNATTLVYYPGWLGYKGVYSGKIFEYLGTGLPILIAPGDKDVIDELLKKTEAGLSAHSPEEMSKILNKWYSLWLNNKKIPIKPNISVKEYTRQYQALLFSNFIKNFI